MLVMERVAAKFGDNMQEEEEEEEEEEQEEEEGGRSCRIESKKRLRKFTTIRTD